MKKQRLAALLLTASMLVTQAFPAYAEDATQTTEGSVTENTPVSEDTTEEVPETPESDEIALAALPYGFKGMPADYVQDSEDIALKESQQTMLSEIRNLTPGVDYLKNQIVYFAESEEAAKVIAEAYNAELVTFQYRVATAVLKGGATVAQAVEVGSDTNLNMPIVSPNYLGTLDAIINTSGNNEMPVADPETDEDAPIEESDAAYANTTWAEWVDVLDDPALVPQYRFYSKDSFEPEAEGDLIGGYQWMHDAVGSYEAWGTTMGSPDITAAVIDTGVNDQHEDLIGHTKTITDAVDLTYTDDDGNKITPERLDDSGHGTHVAGIIGATAGNGKGGAGIAPKVNILGLPIFIYYNGSAAYMDSAIISALMYVSGYDKDGTKGKRRADVVNMSIGRADYNPTLQKGITEAYKCGVTICCSRGNQYTNGLRYPCSYDHVIAVTATDRNNTKTAFSSFGAMADIAAPGSEILSTWNGHGSRTNDDGEKEFAQEDRNDWYASWGGTSMATPVVVGACALYMSAVGHVDPDTMEAVLKNSATKLPDKTLGAGLVNVAAMMPDSTANSKLDAPIIYKVSGENEERTKVGSSITLAENETICIDVPEGAAATTAIMSFDGKDPTFKKGKYGKNTWYIDVDTPFTMARCTDSLQFTFKAAYVSVKGTVSKVVTVSVTMKKTDDEYIVISGAKTLAAGKSSEYVATRSGVATKGTSIIWSLEGAPAGVTIDKKGKVKVAKSVAVGSTFKVVATASDNRSVTSSKEVTVSSALTSVYVSFDNGALNEKVNTPVKDKKGIYKSVRMYSADIPSTEFVENELAISIFGQGGHESGFTFKSSSSNPNVAYYSRNKLYAVGEGKTKLTFAALDGSGKKAVLEVNVINPASAFNIKLQDGQFMLSWGKSIQVEPMFGETYGKPTITKAEWSYEAWIKYSCYIDGEIDSYYWEDITQLLQKKKAITVSATGKVTANASLLNTMRDIWNVTKNGKTYSAFYPYIELKARTTDGTDLTSNIVNIYFTNTTNNIDLVYLSEKTSSGQNISIKGNKIIIDDPIPVDSNGFIKDYTYFFIGVESDGMWYTDSKASYSFTSSDPFAASIYYNSEDDGVTYYFVTINKPGKATLTLKALDGANKKITLNVVSTPKK